MKSIILGTSNDVVRKPGGIITTVKHTQESAGTIGGNDEPQGGAPQTAPQGRTGHGAQRTVPTMQLQRVCTTESLPNNLGRAIVESVLETISRVEQK